MAGTVILTVCLALMLFVKKLSPVLIVLAGSIDGFLLLRI